MTWRLLQINSLTWTPWTPCSHVLNYFQPNYLQDIHLSYQIYRDQQMKINGEALKEESIFENDEEKQFDGSTLGCALLVAFSIFLLLNSIFIVPDLLFSFQGSECVVKPILDYPMTLRTWLIVDAFVRVFMSSLILIGGVTACISYKKGARLTKWGSWVLFGYWMFLLAWIILGSVMFWGAVSQSPQCMNTRESTYLNIYFILSYAGILINCAYK